MLYDFQLACHAEAKRRQVTLFEFKPAMMPGSKRRQFVRETVQDSLPDRPPGDGKLFTRFVEMPSSSAESSLRRGEKRYGDSALKMHALNNVPL